MCFFCSQEESNQHHWSLGLISDLMDNSPPHQQNLDKKRKDDYQNKNQQGFWEFYLFLIDLNALVGLGWGCYSCLVLSLGWGCWSEIAALIWYEETVVVVEGYWFWDGVVRMWLLHLFVVGYLFFMRITERPDREKRQKVLRWIKFSYNFIFQQLQILLPPSWKWRITLNCEMLSLSDTLRVHLYGLEHNLAIHAYRLTSCCLILQPEQIFSKPLFTVFWSIVLSAITKKKKLPSLLGL